MLLYRSRADQEDNLLPYYLDQQLHKKYDAAPSCHQVFIFTISSHFYQDGDTFIFLILLTEAVH